jgi:dihydroorotase
MNTITLIRPDDWHLHLRDGDALKAVVGHTAAQFGRAIVMPNLSPPVTTVAHAVEYRQRILAALPTGTRFNPLMTLYLTDSLSPTEIRAAAAHPDVHAVKLYPAHATTNSAFGVTDIRNTYNALAAMEETGLPLLVHGEVTKSDVDIFDREKVFIDTILLPLIQRFPKLKVVLEHITTKEGVDFVKTTPATIGGTITAHHLLYNRNALFQGGIRPHYYCLPVLKREAHRLALVEAATSGNPKFFLGTDSAPHAQSKKEHACGCAGIYTAHAAIELYAEVFEQAGAIDKLEGFASHFGPDFYGLPRNTDTITLTKESWVAPDCYPFGAEFVIPLRANESILWKLNP